VVDRGVRGTCVLGLRGLRGLEAGIAGACCTGIKDDWNGRQASAEGSEPLNVSVLYPEPLKSSHVILLGLPLVGVNGTPARELCQSFDMAGNMRPESVSAREQTCTQAMGSPVFGNNPGNTAGGRLVQLFHGDLGCCWRG
jgi:hypothetical protein